MGDPVFPGHLLGDDALLGATLELGDPRELPNLLDHIPEGAEIDEMEAAYNWRKEKLRCAKCQRKIHNRGYSVRLTNGHRILLGKDCGREHFPGSFEEHLRTFDYRLRRQRYLRRMAPLDRAIDAALAALESWRGPMRELREHRREFRRCFTDLYGQLSDVTHKSDGELTVPKRRRASSAAAEIAEIKQMIRPGGGSGGAKYETVYESRGRLRGREFFFTVREPYAMLGDAAGNLAAAKKKLRRRNPTNLELRQVLQAVREASDKLDAARNIYLAAREFLDRTNLMVVVSWANEHPHIAGPYRLTVRELVLENDWNDDVMYPFDADLPEIDRAPVEALRTQYQKDRSAA